MKRRSYIVGGCLVLGGMMGMHLVAKKAQSKLKEETSFVLMSPAFEHDAAIPEKYTCQAGQPETRLTPVSPPLRWMREPAQTKSFALIVDDPDAMNRQSWVHWVVFNIPVYAVREGLSEGSAIAANRLGVEGTNTWGKVGYGAPCPQHGEHRYRFTLYALDTEKVDLDKSATKEDLIRAMHGHVLATAELYGRFKRQGP